MVCTFFGHRDCGEGIYETLLKEVERQVFRGVTCFYVGDSGNFDRLAQRAVAETLERHSEVEGFVVLSRIPAGRTGLTEKVCLLDTICPDGLETVLPKFAVKYRNLWMLERRTWSLPARNVPLAGHTPLRSWHRKKEKRSFFCDKGREARRGHAQGRRIFSLPIDNTCGKCMIKERLASANRAFLMTSSFPIKRNRV